MSGDITPRWRLRLENFIKAELLLLEAVRESEARSLSDLEKAGLIQRFEICWEAGWKAIRDFLSDRGSPVDVPIAINVIRAALAVNLISDGDGWVDAMKQRNTTSHEYDEAAAASAVEAIKTRYLALFAALAEKLSHEAQSDDIA